MPDGAKTKPFHAFRHANDDRPFVYDYSRFSQTRKRHLVKFLLDWGATDTWIPDSAEIQKDAAEVSEFTLTNAEAVETFLFQAYVEIFGLKTSVNAAIGDKIIGCDILYRFDHQITPPTSIAASSLGWYTVNRKAGEVDESSISGGEGDDDADVS